MDIDGSEFKPDLDLYEEKSTDHYIGHRKRLREKYLQNQDVSLFPEYELLELLLSLATPRGDMKPLAKILLKKYKNIANVITAPPEQLKSIKGVGDSALTCFKVIIDCSSLLLKSKIDTTNILKSWDSLVNYLKITMGSLDKENFRVLYLNKTNRLIGDEILEIGTIDSVYVYPREVVKKAMFYNASAIILVHNHPSGNLTPSRADIEITNNIVKTLAPLNIIVHDHVIISKNEYFSFKSNLLL